jgi:acyl-CoA reductase-like NAD-dependent aldehyde dehydrogenase
LLQLLGEIDEAIASLHAWMSPELGIPSLANMGGITCITKEPMGAVLIISAWNYPLYLLLNPLVGAISAGNVACLKPSEYAPATANVTQRLVGKYLDPSCFGVVLGGETETKALLAQRWDKVCINLACCIPSIPKPVMIFAASGALSCKLSLQPADHTRVYMH